MGNTIYVTRHQGYATFSSKYDPGIVATIKDTVPSTSRLWKVKEKVWRVDYPHVEGLLSELRRRGFMVAPTPRVEGGRGSGEGSQGSGRGSQGPSAGRRQSYAAGYHAAEKRAQERVNAAYSQGLREGQALHGTGCQRGAQGHTGDSWAYTLLAGCEGDADAVYKALSRVLHPDTGTGNDVLMRDLNSARDKIHGRNTR